MQKESDEASPKLKMVFLQMMRKIAEEMDKETQFLTDINMYKKKNPRAPPPKVLDLCMAPGGFSSKVRDCLSPLTEIYGITLPTSLGGHDLLVEEGPRLNVEFVDITMLAAEMGATSADIPLDHPDHSSFVFNRPYFSQRFDLILSDGQVLRTHKRQDYRGKMEALRLSVSQLVFAMQHIKNNGTFVMLLHRVDCWPVLKLIYTIRKFSSRIQLFKPTKNHAIRSSFYLVAKGVQPEAPEALRAVVEWKEVWMSTTLRFATWSPVDPTQDEVSRLLADFGDTFIEMCEPLWQIQSKALERKLKNGFSIL